MSWATEVAEEANRGLLAAVALAVLVGAPVTGCDVGNDRTLGATDSVTVTVEGIKPRMKPGALNCLVRIDNRSRSAISVPAGFVKTQIGYRLVSPDGDSTWCPCLISPFYEGQPLVTIKPGGCYGEGTSIAMGRARAGRWALLVTFESPRADTVPTMIKGRLAAKPITWVLESP